MKLQGLIEKVPIKKSYLILIIILLVLYIIYTIVSNILYKPDIKKSVPYVRTLIVGTGITNNTSTYPGEVRGRYESDLAFQVGGKIIKRFVNLGDTIKKGQLLMQLDPQDIMQELLASQAAASSAHANYILARDNATRYNKLFTQGATSQLNTQQYQTQFEAALASLNQANAQLEVSQNKFNYTNLYADNDGVVAGVTGEVGQVVAAGTPTISIIQSGEQEVQIYIPENHLDKINLNQNADIDFWALKDVTATGFIREIAPMSDSVTRTYKVHVAIPTMPQDVKLGMTAKVKLKDAAQDVMLLPLSAVYQKDDVAKVWLVKDNRAITTPVVINGYEGNNVKIKSGLVDGDIVITAGINSLLEGQEVKVEVGG